MNPELSVIFPVYKEPLEVLRRTVSGINNQTFKDFEVIVVLDNPDNSLAENYVKDLAQNDHRFRFFKNEKNLGSVCSRNRGIKEAFGEFIAFHDADDFSLPSRFEKQIKYLKQNPEVDVLGTALLYIYHTEEAIFERHYPKIPGIDINKYSPVGNPSLMTKKVNFNKFGLFNNSDFCRYNEDYEMLIRWYIQGAVIHNLDEVLVKYYQSDFNIKNTNATKQLTNTIRVKWHYRKQLKFTIGNYLYMFAEVCLLLLPANSLVNLFYFFQKRKHKNNQ